VGAEPGALFYNAAKRDVPDARVLRAPGFNSPSEYGKRSIVHKLCIRGPRRVADFRDSFRGANKVVAVSNGEMDSAAVRIQRISKPNAVPRRLAINKIAVGVEKLSY
jgi:hypothetical protein